MQYAPARRALAGSVLVLGSVGTVSAVHLDSAHVPTSPQGRSSAAMAPPALPDTQAVTPSAPSKERPAASAPSRSGKAVTRHGSRTADRPVTSRDLIDMAHGPRGSRSVVLPVHDIEQTLPLRSTLRTGRHDGLGTGLRSLDDILTLDGASTSGRWQGSTSRDFDSQGLDDFRSDYDGSDLGRFDADRIEGHHRAFRSTPGYHRADFSWDTDDVSYSRPQCGRHRAQ